MPRHGIIARLSVLAALPLAAQSKVDFLKDVKPILEQKCHSCHGAEAQQAGLRLDLRQNAMRGGDYGPVIVPGKASESKFVKRIVNGDGDMQMPPTGALQGDEIATLRAWIDQGADWVLEVKEDPKPRLADPNAAAFIAAIRSGDAAAVAKVIAADPKAVSLRDEGDSTPLHHAAGFAPANVVQTLIAKGANVNAKNSRGSTPLLWAIHDLAKVKILVEAGAAVNAKQVEGRSPIYQAALTGNGIATVRFLLEKGADANAATMIGLTPLMAAANRGDAETMRLLIARSAKVDAKAGTGATALIAAAGSGEPAAAKLLLDSGADPNAATKKKDTALGAAATSGVEESVKLLLASGARVNDQDDRGYSPLMYAAGSDAMPAGVVKLLLAAGADISATGEGETARSLAAKRGDSEVARMLGVPDDVRKLGGVAPAPAEASARPVAESVAKAFTLLEKQSHAFIRIGGCNSCHAQDLPSAAAAMARDRGLSAPREIAQLSLAMSGTSHERVMDFNVIGVASIAWQLFDTGMNRVPASAYTDAVVRYLKAMQTAEGNWHASQGRRPPMSAGEYQAAALAIYSLRHYSPTTEKRSTDEAVNRAAAWLAASKPANTQDRAFQVMGLAWAKAKPGVIATAARALADSQREDGGWSQLPTMGSDAYATGQATYALHLAGRSASDPVVKKGTGYLLRTQAADGSWHVKTRSIWFQPYFESGFPYGHDQWISTAGTAWASMALAATTDTKRTAPLSSAGE
ncbi:MAG: hypothetical protein FJW38_16800 [Acidobacteria bacterium]|nr:hypothetical protein [Acidobacteriota bacterium]